MHCCRLEEIKTVLLKRKYEVKAKKNNSHFEGRKSTEYKRGTLLKG